MAGVTALREVLVEGDGVAAVCCARLLRDAGVPVGLLRTERPKLAAVLLGEATQSMLRELFPGGEPDDDLFTGFARVRRRIVLWGQAGEVVEMPHQGVVALEGELLRRLWERVGPMEEVGSSGWEGWSIYSSRGSIPEVNDLCFGSRRASLCLVELREDAGEEACWVESVPSGWLFAMCLGGGRATLIGVGATIDTLLGESRLVSAVVRRQVEEVKEAAAYPRMLEVLAGARRFACGSAAMAFDPLCGEGTGNAVREAFLAAAAVRAGIAGGDLEGLAAHYNARLRQGFYRHLEICRQFYATGGVGGFWETECASLEAGMRGLQVSMQAGGRPRYRLADRDLVPIGG